MAEKPAGMLNIGNRGAGPLVVPAKMLTGGSFASQPRSVETVAKVVEPDEQRSRVRKRTRSGVVTK